MPPDHLTTIPAQDEVARCADAGVRAPAGNQLIDSIAGIGHTMDLHRCGVAIVQEDPSHQLGVALGDRRDHVLPVEWSNAHAQALAQKAREWQPSSRRSPGACR